MRLLARCVAAILAGCAHQAPAPVATAEPAPTSAGPTPAADAGLSSELAIDGPLASRLSTSPADLVLFYGSEQRGSMETCGCPHRPRGSLARTKRYVDAARQNAEDTTFLLVNAGEWLTEAVGFQGTPMPQRAVMDRTAAKGFVASGWDALNVTPRDLAGLSAVDSADLALLPMVSANIEGPGIAPSRIVRTAFGRTYGITGIAGPGGDATGQPGYQVRPAEAALPVVLELAGAVDAIVLLAYDAADAAKAVARRVPKVVAVVDAGDHNQYVEPFYVHNAVWVLSFVQTMRLGELRLALAPDGTVAAGLDRHIDLDPEIPDDPVLKAMQDDARRAIEAAGG